MTMFSPRLSKMLVAVISRMKNSLEWTSQKVWVWGLGCWVLGLVLVFWCSFGFLQTFANQSSRDAANSIVWVIDISSTAGPWESQTFQHHLLSWVSGRTYPFSFFLFPVLEQSASAMGLHHVSSSTGCCGWHSFSGFTFPATEWKTPSPHGAKHWSHISWCHRSKFVHHFGRVRFGEISVWRGGGWLFHAVFKIICPYRLSFNSWKEAGTSSHHVLYLIWQEQSHVHSVICIRFVWLSHLVSIPVKAPSLQTLTCSWSPHFRL